MKKKTTRLLSWEKREEDLRKVIRYHRFEVMFYRTNLALHSARVQQLVRRLLPFILPHYPSLDARKTLLISKFHDDHEMVSKRGDVPLQLKLVMGRKALSKLKLEELAAAELLSDSYGDPTIEGYSYRELVTHAILKDCPEAQLHSFADKVDGYCEALHEVLAGNTCFLDAVINYIATTFGVVRQEFPLIARAFDTESGPFAFPVVSLMEYFENGRTGSGLHTPLSIQRKTDIPHYEMWKQVTLELPDGLEALSRQKEFRLPGIDLAEEGTSAPVLSIAKRRPAVSASRARRASKIVS